MGLAALLLAATLIAPPHVVQKYNDAKASAVERSVLEKSAASPVPPLTDDFPYQYTPEMPQHLGVNIDLNICPPAIAERCAADPQMYKLLRRSGVTNVRYTLYWNNVEPEPGKFNWSQPDAEIKAMRDAGLHIYLNVAGIPAWATGGKPTMEPFECAVPTFHDDGSIDLRFDDAKKHCTHPAPVDLDAVAGFANSLVRKYWSSVQHYGILNEIEYDLFFPYGEHTPERFIPDYDAATAIYQRFHDGIKDMDRRLVVHGPETGIAETLEELLKREQQSFDVINIHNYGWDHKDFPASAHGQLDQILEVVKRYGHGRDVWVTETGFASKTETQGSMREQARRVLAYVQGAEERGVQKIFLYRGQGGEGPDYGLTMKEAPAHRNRWAGSPVLSKPVLRMLSEHIMGKPSATSASCDPDDSLYDDITGKFMRYSEEDLAYVPVP